MVHICNGILFSHKNEWNPAIFDPMDGPQGHYTKWNESDGEKQYYMTSFYVRSKKQKQKQITKITKTKVRDTENWLVAARSKAGSWEDEEGGKWYSEMEARMYSSVRRTLKMELLLA